MGSAKGPVLAEAIEAAPEINNKINETIHAGLADLASGREEPESADPIISVDLQWKELGDLGMGSIGLEGEIMQKMRSLKHLEVDEDILRSISLKKTLHAMGRIWRVAPCDLPWDRRLALWELSRPTPDIQVFLSHTWWTKGWWKVAALLLQFGWKVLVLAWVIVTLAIIFLYVIGAPRPFRAATEETFLGTADCHVGPWLMAAYLPAIVVGACYVVYGPRAAETKCFLDVACIHQGDEGTMLRGIYGLGGFLSRSKELRILWSPPLLSRLWCVFEIAAYRAAKPDGQLQLAPLFVESTFLALWLSVYCVMWLMYFVAAIQSPFNAWWPLPALPLALLPQLVVTHVLRRFIAEKHKLIQELKSFDVDKAGCRLEFDRRYVNAAIEAWYGSKEAFNEYVRDTLRSELAAGSAQVPVGYFLLICTLTSVASMETSVGLWLDGASYELLLLRGMVQHLGFSLFSQLTSLRLLVYLSDRLAVPRLPYKVFDYMQTAVVFLIYAMSDLASYSLQQQAVQSSMTAAALYTAGTFILASVCHCGLFGDRRRSCRTV
mmetsp:Transcript_11553/g.21882  ORF Transcript_11553/g.21882 Transcript_11553/m.21882 type:complete len:549 (-) Transcript_11553:385-2031(-)